MGYARKSIVSLNDTPYYHVIGRCVRRSWLWGVDSYTRKDYSHRKQWVLDRLVELSAVFAVDVCAYAVMSNHYHLVVRIDRQRAASWTVDDVIDRWSKVFDVPALIKRWRAGETTGAESLQAEQRVLVWRSRLYDVSWYMRCLNEHLARRANSEDNCTGRFWEGRFKSQALLDETGLLTAMAYVDLNPVRAGIASSLEASDFTSIQARIAEVAARNAKPKVPANTHQLRLIPFGKTGKPPQLPFSLKNYCALLEWTGRQIRKGKRGQLASDQPSILSRLKIDEVAWTTMMRPKGNRFGRALGPLDHLRLHARTLGQAWIRGLRAAAKMYRTT